MEFPETERFREKSPRKAGVNADTLTVSLSFLNCDREFAVFRPLRRANGCCENEREREREKLTGESRDVLPVILIPRSRASCYVTSARGRKVVFHRE